LNALLFVQKYHSSKQNAEPVSPQMTVQMFTVFPLFNQSENVLVLNLLKDLIAQTTFFPEALAQSLREAFA
jgi:hypothetical protein